VAGGQSAVVSYCGFPEALSAKRGRIYFSKTIKVRPGSTAAAAAEEALSSLMFKDHKSVPTLRGVT
jgi:hypothetical protein